MTGAFAVLALVAVQLVLPAWFIYDIALGRNESRAAWWLKVAAAAAYIGFVFIAGRWDFVSYYMRFVPPAAFVIGGTAGLLRLRRTPPARTGKRRVGTATLIGNLASLLLFAGLLFYAVRGYHYDGTPLTLSSPLRDGAFYVGQGGNSPLVNYHNTHATQRFAVDIVELNAAGARASSFHPASLDEYVIFGRPVHSPCSGTVVATVDGLDDNIPPRRDSNNAAGNHVIVDCRGVRVTLAHLQRGSVSVRQGDAVSGDDVIARVGNSGNTSEPHLHVHAVRDESAGSVIPVPIVFDGTFPVRNTVLRPSPSTAANAEPAVSGFAVRRVRRSAARTGRWSVSAAPERVTVTATRSAQRRTAWSGSRAARIDCG